MIPRTRRGVAAVWLAVIMIVLVGLVGLASDTAFVIYAGQQLQIGADAAALAGALCVLEDAQLAHDQAIALAAQNVAYRQSIQLAANPSNDPAGDVVIGVYSRTTGVFTPTLYRPNAVKVVARRTTGSPGGPLPLFFGPIFGVRRVNVQREAIAMTGGGTGAGVIVLDWYAPRALEVWGNAVLSVANGDIQVNSDDEEAAFAQGSAIIDTPLLKVAGQFQTQGSAVLTGQPREGASRLDDPLDFLQPPNYDTAQDRGAIAAAGTYSPGYYSGGVDVSGEEAVVLEPGLYVLDGAGLRVRGTVSFTANGVMLYIVGTGIVDLTGTGAIQISPVPLDVTSPLPPQNLDEPYPGVSIWQARDNHNTSTMLGTALLDLQGTIYCPGCRLVIGGTGDGFGNQLIAGTLMVYGAGVKTITYDGRFPAVGKRVFLVR